MTHENETNQYIVGSIEKGRAEFEAWARDPGNRLSLAMPEDALRYFSIPLRLQQIVKDPQKLAIRVAKQERDMLDVLVVETRDTPLSDEQQLSYFVSSQQTGIEPIPATFRIDPFHVDNFRLIQKGTLSLKDFVITNFGLTSFPNGELYVEFFENRNTFRRLGVATSFYSRLRICAAQLGFDCITGINNSEELVGFYKRMGRSSLDEIVSSQRERFIKNHGEEITISPHFFTIDFLNLLERTAFVMQQ